MKGFIASKCTIEGNSLIVCISNLSDLSITKYWFFDGDCTRRETDYYKDKETLLMFLDLDYDAFSEDYKISKI